MSSHPNTLLVAQIKVPKGTAPEEFASQFEDHEVLVDDEYLTIVASDDNDQGVFPQDDEHVAVYEYVTYGWGDTILLEHFNRLTEKFVQRLINFCTQYNCTITSVKLGANYW